MIPTEPAVFVEIFRRISRTPLIGLGVLLVLGRAGRGAGRAGPAARRTPAGGAGCSPTTAADVRTGALARGAWPVLLGLSAAALAGYLVLFLVAARSAGATAPTLALLPPLLLALIAMGLPISVGGWGPREGVAALSLLDGRAGRAARGHQLGGLRGAGADRQPARGRRCCWPAGSPGPRSRPPVPVAGSAPVSRLPIPAQRTRHRRPWPGRRVDPAAGAVHRQPPPAHPSVGPSEAS